MKNCSRFPNLREHWTSDGREQLEAAWNENIHRGRKTRLSIRAFAQNYHLDASSLSRELSKGTEGKPFYDKIKHEWFYPEYSAMRAESTTRFRATNKGRRWSQSPLSNHFVDRLIETLSKGFSVATCLHQLQHEGWAHLHSQRTVYYALKNAYIHLPDGRIRYCPRKRRHHHPPAKGRVLPERRSIEERPEEINTRATFGHWEMDCVCSCRSGKGGLLVLCERLTRYYIISKLNHISQKSVATKLRRLMRENAFHSLLSVTTDNGCEFLNQALLEKLLHAPVYYTHAYASYEKGSVENANGCLRFWCPKSTTDFSRLTCAEIRQLQDNVNSIFRPISLKGSTANEAFQRFSTCPTA